MTMTQNRGVSAVRDMTEGPILKQLVLFALPLLAGNIFQLLYNTVDTLVVGNFVGKEALAAVGSTSSITAMVVMFFSGFATGAGVVISRRFGAKDTAGLHIAIETTMAASFVICALITVLATVFTVPLLHMMSTPEDVMEDAATYLRIYFGGISGLLVYNMGGGVLRAVGDTRHPLHFLILSSILNTVLDLLFVIVFHKGVAGVAWATVLSQAISAVLVLWFLSRSGDVYRLTWKDLRIHRGTLGQIFAIGMPAGMQSAITAFSNVFVQGYINFFGSACMAGYSCYLKLDQYVFLPIQSLAMSVTTFTGQNLGAGKRERAERGIRTSVLLSVGITAISCLLLVIFARQATALFSDESDVVDFGVMFVRTNTIFLVFNCVNHVLAGALRGLGDSKGPMYIMLFGFVAVRQVYLFLITRFVANTAALVGFGYPVGWMVACTLESLYYFHKKNKHRGAAPA